MDFIKLAKENENLCIQMRRDLHMIPELGLNLPKTSTYVKNKLESFGIDYIEMIDDNAIVATVEGLDGGKCFAIRADMDALPIDEETGADYTSTHPGKMHACGHDSHTAIALATAKIVSENRDKFKGKIKFIFQPGEELPGGAKPMIDEGALKNPSVDYIIGMHGGRIMDAPHGFIGFKKGPMMASMDKFTILVNGKGGHGAKPEETIDPILISSQIIMNLQTIISRNISPLESGLISVCKINGGFNQNIIPNKVEMMGTARSLNENTRDMIERRMREIVENTAILNGASAQLNYERCYPLVDNNPELTEYAKNITEKLFPGETLYFDKPTMGGEDFAFYQKEVPGSFIIMSNPKIYPDGQTYPNHNSKFDLDESLFYKAIATFLAVTFNKLNN